MSGARAAAALYVALAIHLLALLLVLLVPPPQLAPGAGQGLGLGLRLAGRESVLAVPRASPSERVERADSPAASRPRRAEPRGVQLSRANMKNVFRHIFPQQEVCLR